MTTRLNEYIHTKLTYDPMITETSCEAILQDQYLIVTYTLVGSDCLFDFTNTANKVELKIEKSYFDKYEYDYPQIIEKQSICCNTQAKLYDLINCTMEDGISKAMYIESIILYLLFQIQKNNLLFQINCESCSFVNKPLDMEKIQKTKEYIRLNLDQNITIPVLATYAGTNQCYLKKAFKEAEGLTIFEYLQQNRMVKASHLIANSSKNLSEIASLVGYSSISSFSQSYKNYYGISPNKSERKSQF